MSDVWFDSPYVNLFQWILCTQPFATEKREAYVVDHLILRANKIQV